MSSASAEPPSAAVTASRSSRERRHVEADDVRAVARERRGDRRADAAGGAGDERDAPGQRALQIDRRRAPRRRRRPHHLAGDVGRARREQEAQRRGQAVLGAGRDADELHGRSRRAISLPSERVKPSSARCAVASRGLARPRAACRARPRRPQRSTRRTVGAKNACSSASSLARGDPGRVEDERLEALLGRRLRVEDRGVEPGAGRGGPQVVAQLGRHARAAAASTSASGAASRPPGAAPSRTRPVDHRPARRVALQLDRLRQADAAARRAAPAGELATCA